MTQKQNLTIDDIARELGVSKTTISRAISGKGRIGAETRARVLDYIQQCNYRPSAAAKGLAESRTYNLALVLPKVFIKLDIPFVRMSMSAICEEAFMHDYNVLVCLSTDENPASLLRTLDNRKVDAVILSRTVENDALVEILTKRGIPFATLGSLPHSQHGAALVEADHDQVGGCLAFSKAFLSKAEGKIAFIGNDMDYIVNQSRMLGFRQAVEELGVPEDRLYILTGLCGEEDCKAAADKMIDLGISNILAMDDDLCRFTMNRLKERNISVPEQVQIGSLSDSEQLQSYSLSALQFDAAELGRVACRELLRYLKGETHDPAPVLGYRICMRGSTR